jgi:hypothetical protein
MKSTPEFTYRRILEQLKHHFDFLFKEGFSIVSVIYVGQYMEQWDITLISRNCYIKIYDDGREIMLAVSKSRLFDKEGFFDLRRLVSLVTGGMEEIPHPGKYPMSDDQQFEQLAYFLRRYKDDILETLDSELSLPRLSVV